MKFIFFILFFFSNFLSAESIPYQCEDEFIQNDLKSLSLESDAEVITAKLFNVYCKGESGENTLILFNDLMIDFTQI